MTETTQEARALATRWALVTARDIMRRDVVTVHLATPLSEVERVLSEHRISGAPVVDERGAIVGVVSMKDLVARYGEDPDARPRRGPGYYRLPTEELYDEDEEAELVEVPAESEETARDVMNTEVFSVPAEAGLREIAATMVGHKIHRVLVEDRGRHVGLISTLEILDVLGA